MESARCDFNQHIKKYKKDFTPTSKTHPERTAKFVGGILVTSLLLTGFSIIPMTAAASTYITLLSCVQGLCLGQIVSKRSTTKTTAKANLIANIVEEEYKQKKCARASNKKNIKILSRISTHPRHIHSSFIKLRKKNTLFKHFLLNSWLF